MPDDKEVELTEDEEALKVVEDTLEDMRGDKSYDDTDSDDDTAQITEDLTNDQEEEENEEAKGEQQSTEGDSAESGAEAGPEGEAKDEGEDLSGKEDDGAPADEGLEADPEEQSVEEDDKLAASMTEKTRERFDHFREENKRITEEYETQGAEFTQLRESTEMMNHYINDSQISPEQLSTALSLAKAINTGDIELARHAFPRMQQMMNHIAIGLGDDSAHVEIGSELQVQQDNLDITPELARKQALSDAQNQQRNAYQQQHNQVAQQQQNVQLNAQQAANDIKQWENGMVSGDPDFGVKRTQMLKSSEDIMRNNPPEEWLPKIQEQYGTITETMNVMSAQLTRENAKLQGMRPTTTTGQNQAPSEPKNLDDLIKQDLARMRGQA